MREDFTCQIKATINQGATFVLRLARGYYPYYVEQTACGDLIKACSREPVNPADYQDEDYTGCTAEVVARASLDSEEVLFFGSTTDGRIVFDGPMLVFTLADEDTRLLDFDRAIAHINVTRPDGKVQRQYEVSLKLKRAVIR